jgi:hypothetical protein
MEEIFFKKDKIDKLDVVEGLVYKVDKNNIYDIDIIPGPKKREWFPNILKAPNEGNWTRCSKAKAPDEGNWTRCSKVKNI